MKSVLDAVRQHITTPLTSKVQVQLYDLLGQQILNESYTPEELENHIFALDVAAGIYQAVIRQEDHTEVVKIIKK